MLLSAVRRAYPGMVGSRTWQPGADWFLALPIEHHAGEHSNGIDRISQVMRNDSDHIIACANSGVHLLVEPGIVDCERSSARELLCEKDIICFVARCFAIETEHAKEMPASNERSDNARRRRLREDVL